MIIVKEKCFKVSKVVSIILKWRKKKKNGRRKTDPTNGSIGLKIYMCAAIKETCLMLLKNGKNEINIDDLVSIISRPKTGKSYKSVLSPPFLFAIRKLLCQGYLVLYGDGLLDIVWKIKLMCGVEWNMLTVPLTINTVKWTQRKLWRTWITREMEENLKIPMFEYSKLWL